MARTLVARGFIALLLLSFTGCSDEPGPVDLVLESGRRFWIGSFEGATDSGCLSLELVVAGNAVRGNGVAWSARIRAARGGAQDFAVSGWAQDDVIHLDLLADALGPNFTLDGAFGLEQQIEGELSSPELGTSAHVSCRPLERRNLTVLKTHVFNDYIEAVAFDGAHLLLSIARGDFVKITPEMTIVGMVTVQSGSLRLWTRGLAFDGNLYWGIRQDPIPMPDGTSYASEIVGFEEGGQVVSTFRLPHLTRSIAFDGTDLWSLDQEYPRLYRHNAIGTIEESLDIEVPDPVDLEADGTSLWTTGWYQRKLYQLDRTGRVLAVHDLPVEGYSMGLARDGDAFYYVEYTAIARSQIHRLQPD